MSLNARKTAREFVFGPRMEGGGCGELLATCDEASHNPRERPGGLSACTGTSLSPGLSETLESVLNTFRKDICVSGKHSRAIEAIFRDLPPQMRLATLGKAAISIFDPPPKTRFSFKILFFRT